MVRRLFFQILDFLKGRPIKNHLSDLLEFDNNGFDQNSFQRFQKERLHRILIYAKSNVEFYKELSTDHCKLPVLNKLDIRNRLNEFISEEFEERQIKEVVTSGSTGLPFKVFHNIGKLQRNSADTIRFGELGGFHFGSPLAYLKIWNNINKKSKLIRTVQNIIPINVINLSEKNIRKVVSVLNKKKEVSLLGYVSALESVAACIKRCDLALSVKIKSIITMSEGIGAKSRNEIQRIFNCPVYARYSNVENGIIAQQTSVDSEKYLINSSSYYVEILDFDHDVQVRNGKIGRIVVTDFFNRAMPMIRYDTGDIGSKIIGTNGGNTKEYLINVGGRRMDAIFNTQGELVSSFIITNGMWNYSELVQYQFIQKSHKNYFFKLISGNNFDREDELRSEFQEILGSDAIIEFEYLNEIPLLSSGKRKKVVNLMNQ